MNATASISNLEQALSLGSIEAYINWTRLTPILSKEEEHELAIKLKRDGDLSAARQLIVAHLRFVVHITRGYLGYGLAQADLIQEGNIGLMKAVKRFDPKFGVRLISFAVHWIKAEIHNFILRNWRIVRIATTKSQRKLFFNLRKLAKQMGRIGWLNKEEIYMVAKELKVSPQEVIKMDMRLNSVDVAFDCGNDYGTDAHGQSLPSLIDQNSESNPALKLENSNWIASRKECLQLVLEQLDARSKDILEQRWLKNPKTTLQELALKYKVSIERIRQLESNTLSKLKRLLGSTS